MAADIAYFRGSPERLAVNRGAPPPDDWFPRIVIVGDIAPGDTDRFSKALDEARRENLDWWKIYPKVELHSLGGDVATAMSIGRRIRQGQLCTRIRANGICASACVLVLAGGVSRYAPKSSRVGLHRPFFTNATKATSGGYETFQRAYSSVLEAHRAYFGEMRIPSTVLDIMSQIPSDEVRWIDLTTAARLQLTGEDPTYAEWRRAEAVSKQGPACVAWTDRWFDCVISQGTGVPGTIERCEAAAGVRPPNCD